MATTRAVRPPTIRAGGIDWTIGEPTGGWGDLSLPQWQRVQKQFPAYARYKQVVDPQGFVVAFSIFSRRDATGQYRHASLNALLTQAGYDVRRIEDERHDTPLDSYVGYSSPSRVDEVDRAAEVSATQARWAAQEARELGDYQRWANRNGLDQNEETLNAFRAEGSPEPKRPLNIEEAPGAWKDRPSNRPQGRRMRYLRNLVQKGLYGSVDEADASVPKRGRKS